MKDKFVYHCIIGCKDTQFNIGESIISPLKEPRDYAKWPKYKQCSEKLLDNYRIKHHLNYPSRNNCMFVCKDEESAKEWGMYKCRTSQCDNFYLYTLKILEGDVSYFDSNWFEQLAVILSNGDILCSNQYSVKECVQGYWHGKTMRGNEGMFSEGLFNGLCVVTKIKHFHYDPIKRDLREYPYS